jgi:hypothetical protein
MTCERRREQLKAQKEEEEEEKKKQKVCITLGGPMMVPVQDLMKMSSPSSSIP